MNLGVRNLRLTAGADRDFQFHRGPPRPHPPGNWTMRSTLRVSAPYPGIGFGSLDSEESHALTSFMFNLGRELPRPPTRCLGLERFWLDTMHLGAVWAISVMKNAGHFDDWDVSVTIEHGRHERIDSEIDLVIREMTPRIFGLGVRWARGYFGDYRPIDYHSLAEAMERDGKRRYAQLVWKTANRDRVTFTKFNDLCGYKVEPNSIIVLVKRVNQWLAIEGVPLIYEIRGKAITKKHFG
jgi:hypothetical protein